MKRSFSFSAALGTAAYVLTMAAPALAQDSYSSGEDAAAGAVACGAWACIMIPAVLLGVFNIWMLISTPSSVRSMNTPTRPATPS